MIYSWQDDEVEIRNTWIFDEIWKILLVEILRFFNKAAYAIRQKDVPQKEEGAM